MKRWNIKAPDYTINLYYSDYETAKENNPDALCITEVTDTTYVEYIKKIQESASEILHDYNGRKIYKIPYNGKYILVEFWFEKEGDKEFYYDSCKFQKHNESDLIVPCTWEISNPKEFYEKFLSYKIQNIKIECERCYGQPKLKKPASCNNTTFVGSVDFSFGIKAVKCKVWKDGNVVYVLHRDWFSKSIALDEAEKMGLIEKRKSKFIYNDNFGELVLRNEAILSFVVPNDMHNLVKQFSKLIGTEWYKLTALHRWEDFFSNILKMCEVT